MPTKSNLVVLLGGICIILAIISKAFMCPLPIIPGGVEAQGLIGFGNSLFLIAIYLLLVEKQ